MTIQRMGGHNPEYAPMSKQQGGSAQPAQAALVEKEAPSQTQYFSTEYHKSTGSLFFIYALRVLIAIALVNQLYWFFQNLAGKK
jgi:hypothetical protein